eukprot:gb/GFBE01037770.1/.p1 GENE.gb/GFBE01037770.1/~~gb/GFBE01037770.1/.p1  ORF type:complete len:307 (+),score=69.18 gb/GFBE01037770.1/:1-921(+)
MKQAPDGEHQRGDRQERGQHGSAPRQLPAQERPAKAATMPRISGFICVLCKELFAAPVTTVDGYSYCRQCILDWFAAHDRISGESVMPKSPATKQTLKSRTLLPNMNLREAITSLRLDALPAWESAERERSSLGRKLHRTLDELARMKQESLARLTAAKQETADARSKLRIVEAELERFRLDLDRVKTKQDSKHQDVGVLEERLRESLRDVSRLQGEVDRMKHHEHVLQEAAEQHRRELRAALANKESVQQAQVVHTEKLSRNIEDEVSLEVANLRQALAASELSVADLQTQLVSGFYAQQALPGA